MRLPRTLPDLFLAFAVALTVLMAADLLRARGVFPGRPPAARRAAR